MGYENTYLTVDLDAIEANFNAIHQKAGVPVMAVVKADAYGHGAVSVAKFLENKCAFFGVANIEEALELRHAGISTPILMLGPSPLCAFPQVVRENIRPTLFRLEEAKALSEEACKQNKTVAFHLAVDTGMNRIGMPATEESARLCLQMAALPGLQAEGVFSHLATADCEDLSQAKAQAERFDGFCQRLEELGLSVPIRHLDNSAGLMNFTKHYDMVRAGIVLYGLYPSDCMEPSLLPLRPALSWYSRVTHVKLLPPGCPISYGGTFVTTKPTRVATVAVGYADGYRWSLSGKFYVLIRGKKAPILGRICMDQLMVDVSHIPDASPEDSAVLIGASGKETICVEEISAACHSFPYEFICGINRRVSRIYTRNGKTVGAAHYLTD
ncbi:MAG: alanine racemase [Oscillospiraceae bacterium]|nr:alanine racemase [Oscillospiraceae bacterium]